MSKAFLKLKWAGEGGVEQRRANYSAAKLAHGTVPDYFQLQWRMHLASSCVEMSLDVDVNYLSLRSRPLSFRPSGKSKATPKPFTPRLSSAWTCWGENFAWKVTERAETWQTFLWRHWPAVSAPRNPFPFMSHHLPEAVAFFHVNDLRYPLRLVYAFAPLPKVAVIDTRGLT